MSETVIRVSRGVGSSPKLWACTTGRKGSQVGELDEGVPGVVVPGEYAAGMTGIVWLRGRIAEISARRPYRSVDEWVADIAAEYPGARIVRADDEPQNWL